MTDLYDYCAPLKNSILSMFVGEHVGSGASRDVFSVIHDESLVMKVEHSARTFHNQTEYLLWNDVKSWPIADWFAPVIGIDSYGNVLFQKRTEPFECEKDFHAALTRTRGGFIPKVFEDVHYGNFGMLNGLVVCHDYGYHGFFEQVARDMSVEAGYITFDKEELTAYDVSEGGQLALDI